MELEPSTNFEPVIDRRRRIEEPLLVKLVTVNDARLPARLGQEPDLDALYVEILGFQRDAAGEGLVYRADNFRLRFDLVEGMVRHLDMRPLGIEVMPSLGEVERKLIEVEIEYTRQRGLAPGQESLVLIDPAGNWLEITQYRRIM